MKTERPIPQPEDRIDDFAPDADGGACALVRAQLMRPTWTLPPQFPRPWDGMGAPARVLNLVVVVHEDVEIRLSPRHLARLDTIVGPLLASGLPTVLWCPHGHEAVRPR